MKPKVLWMAGGAVLALLLTCGWTLRVLVLEETHTGRWIFARAVSPGDAFTLRYTHSVKRKPVWDFYIIDDHHEIMQYKTIFPDSDFGLPSHAAKEETYTLLADGNGCISGMRRMIPALRLRVERAYDNIFSFNDSTILNLSHDPGDSVVDLHVHHIGLLHYTFQATRIYGECLWKKKKNFWPTNS